MTKKCLARVEELLSKSTIRSVRKDEIINQIKIAQAEQKISSIDESAFILLNKKFFLSLSKSSGLSIESLILKWL